MANLKAKLNGKHYDYFGGTGGENYRDDLFKIAETLGTTRENLLATGQTLFQDIRIKKLNAWYDDKAIVSFQVIYQIEANGKQYEVIGNKHGGEGGTAANFELPTPGYLMRVRARSGIGSTSWDIINLFEFFFLCPADNSIKIDSYGTFTGNNWIHRTNIGVFYSKSGGYLDAFGYYENEVIDVEKKQIDQLENSKMFLLLQKNKNIQQLKEETKDKVLLTNSKKELLEKWKQYPQSIFLYQSQHKGEYSVLFVNREKQKSVLDVFVNNEDWQTKTTQEVNSFLNPIGLKSEYLLRWGNTNPNNDLNISGYSAMGLIEILLNKIKKGEKYNLGDEKKDQGENNYAYDWNSSDWPDALRTQQQNQLQKEYENITTEDVVNELSSLTNDLIAQKDASSKLIEEWNKDFKTDFGTDLNVANLVEVKETLTTNTLYKDKYDKLNDYWLKNLQVAFEDKTLHPDGLTLIKSKLDQISIWENIFWTKDPNEIKTWWNATIAEWNADFNNEKFKFGKDLNAENLVKVRKSLEQTKTVSSHDKKYQELYESWSENFKGDTAFGANFGALSANGFKVVKNTLDQLQTEKSNLGTQSKGLNEIILKRNETVGELNDRLRERNKNIDEGQNTVNELNTEIENLKEQVSSLKQEKTNSEKFRKELVNFYVRPQLLLFFQEAGIDDNPVVKKYKNDEEYKAKYGENFNYKTTLGEKLTLENRKDMIEAFKAVSCICATEKAEGMEPKETERTKNSITHFLNILNKAKNAWNNTEKKISKENNPFYLSIIEKQQDYRDKLEKLIVKWNEIQNNFKEARSQQGL